MSKTNIVTPHTTLREDASGLRTGEVDINELHERISRRVKTTQDGVALVRQAGGGQDLLAKVERISRLSTEARAIAAVIIADIVNSAIMRKRQLPPYGLGFCDPRQLNSEGLSLDDIRYSMLAPVGDLFHIKGTDGIIKVPIEPFTMLASTMISSLIAMTNEAVRDPSSAQSIPAPERVMGRFKSVLAQLHDITGERLYENPSQIIITGITSGVRHMTDILRLLPEVLKRNGDPKWNDPAYVGMVARASTAQVMRGTKFTLLQFVALLKSGERTPYANTRHNIEWFEVKETKDGIPVIGLTEEIIAQTKDEFPDSVSTSTGCPAGVKLNGRESSVEKLWRWLTQITKEHIYPQILK